MVTKIAKIDNSQGIKLNNNKKHLFTALIFKALHRHHHTIHTITLRYMLSALYYTGNTEAER